MGLKKKGFFITFEGIEGSGKSTQIKLLASWLKEQDISVLLTREPGGTPLADRIRDHLLHPKTKGITPAFELFLYEVSRRDHVSTVVQPALEEGRIVLCDRFGDATLAYQGYGRGLSLKVIRAMNRIASGGLTPNITFLFDLPVAEGLKRARGRRKKFDRLDNESKIFHEKVRRGYLTLAHKEKRRFRIIDARKSRQEIFNRLRREVEKLGLSPRGSSRGQ